MHKKTHELYQEIDNAISAKKSIILEHKYPETQYLTNSDFLDICDTIISTYCKVMMVDEPPSSIVSIRTFAQNIETRIKLRYGVAALSFLIVGIVLMRYAKPIWEQLLNPCRLYIILPSFSVVEEIAFHIGNFLTLFGLMLILFTFSGRWIAGRAEERLRNHVREVLQELWMRN